VGTVGRLQTGVGSVINHGRAACSIILLRSGARRGGLRSISRATTKTSSDLDSTDCSWTGKDYFTHSLIL